MFFNCEYSKLEKYEITFFFKFGKFAIEKDRFLFQSYSQIRNIWNNIFVKFVEKINKKIMFYFPKYYPFTLFPSRREGGGEPATPVIFRVLHIC